jgi:hypothetical protein
MNIKVYFYENDDVDLQNKDYCIGAAIYFPHENTIVVSSTVSKQTFLCYPIEAIELYLAEYSCLLNRNMILPQVHIMQVHISEDQLYTVVLKTFWIKWIQRAWKKQFLRRSEIIQQRSSINSQRYFTLNGNYPYGLRILPTIKGILSYGIME